MDKKNTPEVKLGQYKGLAVTRHVRPVTDKTVDIELVHQARMHAVYHPTTEPAKRGFRALLDFAGYMDGKEIPDSRMEKVMVVLGDGKLMPAAEQAIYGHRAGEVFRFDFTYPQDFRLPELSGKTAQFEIELRSLAEKVTPAPDEAFARSLGFDSLDALKADLRAKKQKIHEEGADRAAGKQLLDMAGANMTVDLPAEILDRTAQNEMKLLKERLSRSGITLEQHCKNSRTTPEALEKDYRAQAESRIRFVLAARAKNRDIQFIHHIGIFAGFIQNSLALGLVCHDLSHHVPCTNILPVTAIPQNLNAGLFLDHSIVKADFGQGIILVEQVTVVLEVDHAMSLVQQIAKFKCKDACIPQCALCQILLGSFHIRLFLEFFNLTDIFAAFRDNVAVLFTWIGRLDAHQCQISTALLCKFLQSLDCLVIGVIHIGIDRADNNSFILCHAHFIVQIGSSQCDSREGITAAGFYTNRCLFAQLILDSTCLRFAGCNGNLGICIYRGDLTIDTLQHRFVFVIILEQLDELLATHIIRKRPESLTRTTRK